ncbi:unnamed protein product, partial [Brenthis ino]
MPKVIRSGVREVVLKIKDFFMKEKQSGAPIIPFERVNERVAAATGISLRTVVRIENEGRLAEASSTGKCWQNDDEDGVLEPISKGQRFIIVHAGEEYTRPQLLEIVNKNKPEPVYSVDAILTGLGHKILRLPPYHCDLNPIEMVWASMKRKVAEINIGKPSNQMPEMLPQCSWCPTENRCFSEHLPHNKDFCTEKMIRHPTYGLSLHDNAECACAGPEIENSCPPADTEQKCSGRGKCVCGRCFCDVNLDPMHPSKVIMGEHCEYDNFSCDGPDCNEGPYYIFQENDPNRIDETERL